MEERTDMQQSMPEDDPNGNVNTVMGQAKPRWGPAHAGARALASMYSKRGHLHRGGVAAVRAGGRAGGEPRHRPQPHLLVAGRLPGHHRGRLGVRHRALGCGHMGHGGHVRGPGKRPLVPGTLLQHFIRSFREHHVDPTAITRHDFVEVNGDNFMLCIPKLAHIVYQHLTYDNDALVQMLPEHWFWLFLGIYVALTNQIHKWSHTYFNLHPIIVTLQKMHIILPRHHHKLHHISPHACSYCITTGWLNYPLDALGFWRLMENMVTLASGWQPRDDDLKWATKTD